VELTVEVQSQRQSKLVVELTQAMVQNPVIDWHRRLLCVQADQTTIPEVSSCPHQIQNAMQFACSNFQLSSEILESVKVLEIDCLLGLWA
jgi:uncharacterized protein YcgI (DUF1989 family)